MAFTIPSITEITDRIITDIEAEYGQTVPLLQRAFFRIWARVLAGALWLSYKYGERVSLNQLPTTAEGDQLDRFAGLFANFDRQAATPFVGDITCTGTNGTIIRVGTLWVSQGGVEYLTLTQGTIAGGVATVSIEANTAGSIGSLTVGSEITLSTDVPGLENIATVATVTQAGSDEESDGNFRPRVINQFAERPEGGAKQDYITWAQTVSGVGSVWPYAEYGSVVTIYFILSGDPFARIPTGPDIANVEAAIDQPDRRPIGSFLNVQAPSEISFDVTVTDFVGDSSGLEDALETLLFEKQMYIDANLSSPGVNIITLAEIISTVFLFGIATEVTFKVTSTSTDLLTYTLDPGELAILGALTV